MIFAAVNTVALAVFIILFALVTVLGFVASRWHQAKKLDNLDEWGLVGAAGRVGDRPGRRHVHAL